MQNYKRCWVCLVLTLTSLAKPVHLSLSGMEEMPLDSNATDRNETSPGPRSKVTWAEQLESVYLKIKPVFFLDHAGIKLCRSQREYPHCRGVHQAGILGDNQHQLRGVGGVRSLLCPVYHGIRLWVYVGFVCRVSNKSSCGIHSYSPWRYPLLGVFQNFFYHHSMDQLPVRHVSNKDRAYDNSHCN